MYHGVIHVPCTPVCTMCVCVCVYVCVYVCVHAHNTYWWCDFSVSPSLVPGPQVMKLQHHLMSQPGLLWDHSRVLLLILMFCSSSKVNHTVNSSTASVLASGYVSLLSCSEQCRSDRTLHRHRAHPQFVLCRCKGRLTLLLTSCFSKVTAVSVSRSDLISPISNLTDTQVWSVGEIYLQSPTSNKSGLHMRSNSDLPPQTHLVYMWDLSPVSDMLFSFTTDWVGQRNSLWHHGKKW